MITDNALFLTTPAMRIELNVLNDGCCARIFAYAETHEQAWHGLRAIKIWHNWDRPSLDKNVKAFVRYENDAFIDFKSHLPFKQFCDTFYASEFNDGALYHFFYHNCAHAARHALQIAGIPLCQSRLFKTRLSPLEPIYVPTNILSPATLYQAARKEKIKRVSGTTHNSISLLNTAYLMCNATTLLHLVKCQGYSSLRPQIRSLIKGAMPSIKRHPEHVEFYIQLLKDTIELLQSPLTTLHYYNYSETLKIRYRHSYMNAFLKGFAAFVILMSLKGLSHNSIQHFLSSTSGKIALMTPLIFVFGRLVVTYLDEGQPTCITETRLSAATRDIANWATFFSSHYARVDMSPLTPLRTCLTLT